MRTSFKALYPELIKEISTVNEYDPDLLVPTFTQTMKWYCSVCEMEWEASIRDRVNGDMDCPFFSGKKTIPGRTSFKVLYPELIKEFSTVNEYDPDLMVSTFAQTMNGIVQSVKWSGKPV